MIIIIVFLSLMCVVAGAGFYLLVAEESDI
jgi:hypothetical protein